MGCPCMNSFLLLESLEKDSENIKYVSLLNGIAESYPEMLGTYVRT